MTALRLSHSQIDAFSQCPLKWYLAYGERLKAPTTKTRLAVGSAWHKVVQDYRQANIDGGTQADQQQAAVQTIADILDIIPAASADEDIHDRLTWMLAGYIQRWAEVEKHYRYLGVEVEVEVPLVDGAVLYGIVDYLKQDLRTGKVIAGDTKTTSNKDVSQSYYSADLTFEPQFMRYAKAITLSRPDLDLYSFEWDAARTDRLKRAMTLDERFNRVGGKLVPAAVERVWAETQVLAQEILDAVDGERRIYASPVSWVCKSRCDYHPAHQLAVDTARDVVTAALDYGFTRKAEPALRLDESDGRLYPVQEPEQQRSIDAGRF